MKQTSKEAGDETRRKRLTRHGPSAKPEGDFLTQGFLTGNVYKVEDLVSVWRASWSRYRPGEDTPFHPHWMRPHLLKWLQQAGHVECENILEYGVKMWTMLSKRYTLEGIPEIRVLYGYRKAIKGEMNRTTDRKWGAHWKGDRSNATEETSEDGVIY